MLQISRVDINDPCLSGVYIPSGSTSFANFNDSDVAMSVLAAVKARMIQFGLPIYCVHKSLICISMSEGWSPTGTLVIPGRSTRVRLSTLGEYILRLIGSGQIP